MKPVVIIETTTKFFHLVRITGWIKNHPAITSINIQSSYLRDQISELNTPNDSGQQRFVVQALNIENIFDWRMVLQACDETGRVFYLPLEPAINDALTYASGNIDQTWEQSIVTAQTILDIGGRARSREDRSKQYPSKQVTVFDILPGDNVDVVGDAHELSKYFQPETFDAAYSVSVFEHLLQPWKIILEINKILRPGGVVLVHTHQTLGMHDMPWDFLRFSADSWDGFFNQKTGFEIIERAARHPSYILPFVMRPGKEAEENSAGFESSTVIARKIGPYDPRLSWPVTTSDVIQTAYPND